MVYDVYGFGLLHFTKTCEICPPIYLASGRVSTFSARLLYAMFVFGGGGGRSVQHSG